jgi:hypothetical protein
MPKHRHPFPGGRSFAIVGLMKADRRIRIRLCPSGGELSVMLLIMGLLRCAPQPVCAGETLPEASEVTRRMVERSQTVARADQGPQYTYVKRSLLERLDDAGQSLKSEEKIYQVTLITGLPFNRLVKIQGRELSAEELRREEGREERFRQRFVSADAKKVAARKEGLVTPELLGRYQFAVEKRVVLRNRPALVLTFKPKDGNLPSRTVQDKLLNRMAGRLWIDEGDADPAKLEVSLVEPIFLGWFGLLGSLNQCDLSLERQRMPDGVWINSKQALHIQCRKLTATMRFRTTEESSGFKKVAR